MSKLSINMPFIGKNPIQIIADHLDGDMKKAKEIYMDIKKHGFTIMTFSSAYSYSSGDLNPRGKRWLKRNRYLMLR